jgi:argonaute-like protein implicated in RNA metabolism and viral defense
MNVQTRVTAQGTEYWDAKEKRVRFVPAGSEPDFEVTKNPKSMVMGVDLAKGTDQTVIQKKVDDKVLSTKVIINELEIDLDEMDAEQLKDFASQNNIKVPGNMKNDDTIRNHIAESLTPAE